MPVTQRPTERSRALHERARAFLPLGVTGDGRYSAPYPIAFARASGKWLHDVDDNAYVDYHGGFGTAILGYAHPEVDAAVIDATREIGAFVGVPHPYEERLAERLCAALPGADRVALCGGGGSDAIYHCVRLARATTGRSKIVKIEGGYHGWHGDVGASTRPALAAAGDDRQPATVPNSQGILPGVLSEIVVATANDGELLGRVFERDGERIAAVLVEPVLYSAGCVVVDPAFLAQARELCTRHGAVLIFDEVMSGFRNGLGGAGARAGVVPDLGAYGKAVANGYMLSFLAGKAELMTQLAPEGPVFYSGTFNGHPLSVTAAMATLDVIERDGVPERLWRLGDRIADGVNAARDELDVDAVCQAYGSVFCVYFGTRGVRNYRDYARGVTETTERLDDAFRAFLRENGVYVHKRHVNRCFIGAGHDDADADRMVELIAEFLRLHREEL
ncbi:MAG TPA: aminotransferase class III-fold pyridoxal phosphate-dependent enzyme [Solirubrobacter sp.]|nr:aminotransferase class III-fold pyridoxal phosphate-dependent enzyme [Solirubrobacter sp.]